MGVRTSRRISLNPRALETKTVVLQNRGGHWLKEGGAPCSPGPKKCLAQCFWLGLENKGGSRKQEGMFVEFLLGNRPLTCVFFSEYYSIITNHIVLHLKYTIVVALHVHKAVQPSPHNVRTQSSQRKETS